MEAQADDAFAEVQRARKIGKRVVLGAFILVVSAIVLGWAVQIIQQVWFRSGAASGTGCRSGVLGLISAVRRARVAAGAETGGERAAVDRFRSALSPEWDARDGLDVACHGDPLGARALREVDRLRFAEERATRYEAVDLAGRRRTIAALEKQLAQP
jgi:hypothetical protein